MKRVDHWIEPASNLGEASGATPTPGATESRGRARIVATIIDPSVREDGLGEPVVLTAAERVRRGSGPDGAADRSGRLQRGHAVRERLLAKARSAAELRPVSEGSSTASEPLGADSYEPAAPSPRRAASETDARDAQLEARERDAVARFEALPELEDDLDLIGAPERPAEPPRPPHPPAAAPAALLLGTLFGITTLAVAFSALIQLVPHEPLVGRTPLAAVAPSAPEEQPAARPQGTVVRPARKRTPGPWRISDVKEDPQASTVSGKVGNNTFLAALQAAGLSLREGYRLLKAFEGVKDLNHSRPRDAFTALVDRGSGRLLAFEYAVSGEEVYQAREGPDGLLFGQKLDLQVRRERVSGVVVVSGGFDASAERAGFEPGLGAVVNKALAGYSSVGEMKEGDVLALVVQEVTMLGEFARYAGVEALEYRPVGNDPVRLYYHATEKTRGYIDSKGRVFGKSRWARPVPGAAITSRFNPKRLHPILKVVKPHNGTDFGAPTGTPVVAAAFGKVTFLGAAGPNGNMITLSHDGGYETGYSHLSRFAKGLKVGDRVDQKQVIGYVGSTGRSTGPHLHFSAKRERRFIDPESLNLDAFSRLAVSDRQVLSQLQQRYDRLLDALPIPEPKAPLVAAARAPESAAMEPELPPTHEASPSLSSLALMPSAAAVTGSGAKVQGIAPVAAPAAPESASGEPGSTVAVATPSAVTPSAATPSAAAAPALAPAPKLSIYLTDKELIARQPLVDDGEVDP